MNWKKIIIGILIALIVAVILFQWVYRPWNLTWGTTDEEVNQAMVGDEIVESPTFVATRAIFIEAKPEEIWPWIVQMGYKRAGFYSYDFLDNDGIPSADRIIDAYQDLEIGDQFPLAEKGYVLVEELEPHRYLLFVSETRAFTWAWGLYETDQHQTRLVTRIHHRMDSKIMTLMWDGFEFFMMHKCLLGIKDRAESLSEDHKDSMTGAIA